MSSLPLPPAFPVRFRHSSLFHIPFTPATIFHIPSNPKILHSPFPPTLSFSSSLPQFSAAAATSFPYSQFQHRQSVNQEDSVKKSRREDFDEQQEDEDDEIVLGDCLVFEEGAFDEENPFLPTDNEGQQKPTKMRSLKSAATSSGGSNSLVPEKWKEVVEEINMTKKEKRKIAHQIRFGSRLDARKRATLPDSEEYLAYRKMKMSQLNPLVLDNPNRFPRHTAVSDEPEEPSSGRVTPRNPRSDIYGKSVEDITEFFNSGDYVPGERNDDKKPQGRRKLFTEEEKTLLNKRIPKLSEATSQKWLPLHTLTSSGEFYLLDLLLKHNVDINAVDKNGLAAIHKSILSKKHAITSYLLRNSANPFVRDVDGATLMHYAVRTASSECIKILLLYDVDINLADNDGWTPLHLAVQTLRTDIVRLLLVKGADRTLKNQDGLTPLGMSLYCGHNMRTYEIIKLLKEFSKSESPA